MYPTIILFSLIFIIFVFCISLQFYMIHRVGSNILNINEYLYYNFGYINYIKSVVFFIIFLILNNLVIIFSYLYNIKINKVKSILVVLCCILSLIIFTLFFLPAHCPLNLCIYSTAKNIKSISSMKNESYISFIGIGDTQIAFDFNSIKLSKNRIMNNRNLINMINLLIIKIINNNYSNIHFNNIYIKQKFKKSSINLIGLINPGDIVQFTGSAGYYNTPNNLGIYEYFYNNNPEDKGLLTLSTYETLGNHDYDPTHLFAKFMNYPPKKTIIRRNKKRKYIVNSDENGNYSCDFGNLHIIFINLHIDEGPIFNYDGTTILSDIPKSNIKFLKNDLQKFHAKLHNNFTSHKWCIVTHNYKKKPFKQRIKNIIKKYEKNFIGILCGHIHTNTLIVDNIYDYTNKYYYILPSPINNNNIIEITYFIFNNINKFLDVLQIKYYNNTYYITKI